MRPDCFCSLLVFTSLLIVVTWSVPGRAFATLSCGDCYQTAGNCQCTINGAGDIVCLTDGANAERDEIRGVNLDDGTYPVIWGWIDKDGANDYFCCDYANGLDSTARDLVVRTFDGDDFVYLNQAFTLQGYKFWDTASLIEVGTGDDRVEGGRGPDDISVGHGNDVAFGYQDDDTIMAPANDTGTNELWGGENNDTIYGGAAFDECYGGPGQDVVKGGAGDGDWVCGDDPSYGNAATPTTDGEADVVWGNEGAADICASDADGTETFDSSCEAAYIQDFCNTDDW